VPLWVAAAFAVFAAERPPNVVLIFADDLGYADVGCFGAPRIRTPSIDRLANEGVRFTDFYVPQAVCSASRAALLTGCYPNRVGILGALDHRSKIGLNPDERTLAETLKTKGYATAVFGKWHLGWQPEHSPLAHGFDEFFGLPYSNDMWSKHPENPRGYPALPLLDARRVVETDPDQSRLTNRYTQRAVDFIERQRDRPFFVYLPQTMPHVPIFVSKEGAGKSRQGLYGDVIEELDRSVGRILESLDRCGVAERTLVIFASDNGPWLSYGNHAGSAGPLREGKGTAWEGGVRVPFVARLPGTIPAGKICSEPAMTIDLLPTIAKLAGAEVDGRKLDGKDVGPLLRAEAGAKSPHEALYFYWGRELHAVRSGRWKLHFPHAFRSLDGKPGGVDGKPAKYVEKRTELALYDLQADVGETRNLASEHPAEVARLQNLADRIRAELGDAARGAVGTEIRAPGKANG
jgi:arylsulfatase A-like enzyme